MDLDKILIFDISETKAFDIPQIQNLFDDRRSFCWQSILWIVNKVHDNRYLFSQEIVD